MDNEALLREGECGIDNCIESQGHGRHSRPVMNEAKAREALEVLLVPLENQVPHMVVADILEAADTYAKAAKLAVHVEACGKRNETPDLPPSTPTKDYHCPDGSMHEVQVSHGAGDIKSLTHCAKCGAESESLNMRRMRSKAGAKYCGQDGWHCKLAREKYIEGSEG